MKLLVDGVAFQHAGSESARLWQSILPALAAGDDVEVMVLDRGGLPSLAGVTRIPFPTARTRYTADDSELVQRLCDVYAVDVFTSSGHTTPLSTPAFLVVPEAVADPAGAGRDRARQEQAIAVAYARRHVCVSVPVRDALLRAYPTLDRVEVVPAGIDHATFRPRDEGRVAALRQEVGFDRRPYLVVHDRPGGDAALLLDTVARFGIDAFDILCIGGATGARRDAGLPPAVRVARVAASGEDLAVALSGAAALVHPSRDAGFGLPVLEAMASGCPVVTTAHGALPEVLGDACLLFDGASRSGLAGALAQARSEAVQRDLREAGLRQAAPFDWSPLVAAVLTAARETAALQDDADYRTFAEAWRTLRLMQAAVDADTWVPSA